MRRWVRKHLALFKADELPFPCALSFAKEIEKDDILDVEETTFYNDGDLMFAKITVKKENCVALEFDYKQTVCFLFPDDYPFTAPTISLEEYLVHPVILFKGLGMDAEIDTHGAGPWCNISQQLLNVYMILCESVNDERNAKVVKAWNDYCRKKNNNVNNNDDNDENE